MSPLYVENYREPWQRGLHHYGGTAVRGLARKGPRLPFVDRAIFWWRADDPEATLSATGEFVSVPNRGSLGGSLTPSLGVGPRAVRLSTGRPAANPTTTGSLTYGTTSSLAALHDPSGNALIAIRLRFDGSGPGFIFGNKSFYAVDRGFRFATSTVDANTVRVALQIGNGSANFDVGSASTNVACGFALNLFARKTGLAYELFFGSSLVGSVTASSLTSGASAFATVLGSYGDDTTLFPGLIYEAAALTGAFTNAEIAALNSYLEYEWRDDFAHPRYASCLLHFQADHPSTSVSYSTAPATVSVAPNLGSLGGTLTPGTGSGPELVLVGGRWATRSTATGSLIFGTTSTFQNLHDPATYATLSFAVNVEVATPSSNKRLLSTKGSVATARGIILYHTSAGTLQFVVSDGASNVLSISGAVLTTGVHSIIITKALLAFAVYVDGVLYASGSASALAAGAQDSVFALGSTSADTTNFDGAVFEALVLSVALTAAEVSQEHFALLRSTFSVETLAGVVTDHDADFGITLSTGISSWVDRRNGVAATQGTAGAQPTLVQNWRFGRAAMLGGSGKLLVTGAIAVGQPCTWIIVGSFAATNTTLMFDGIGGSNRQGFARNASGLPTMTHGTAAGTAGTAIAAGTPFVAILEFGAADSDSVMTIHAHGYAPISISVDPDGAAQSLTGISIGGTYVNSNHWDGHIAKLVPVNRLLTAEEKAASLVQLKGRYGVIAA